MTNRLSLRKLSLAESRAAARKSTGMGASSSRPAIMRSASPDVFRVPTDQPNSARESAVTTKPALAVGGSVVKEKYVYLEDVEIGVRG